MYKRDCAAVWPERSERGVKVLDEFGSSILFIENYIQSFI